MAGGAAEPGRSTASRLLSLLEVFTARDDELTLVEMSRRSGLPVATTWRLAKELTEWGALERRDDRRFRVGLRLWEVASLAPRQRSLRESCLPYLQDLYEVTRETVQVGVPDGNEALILDKVSGRHGVPTLTRVGGRLPLHATAVGKVILAFSGPELLATISREGLRRYCSRTTVAPGLLAESVEKVREAKVAFTSEEMSPGTASVACPLFGPGGQLTGAIAVVVRSSTDVQRLAPIVRTAGLALSRELQR